MTSYFAFVRNAPLVAAASCLALSVAPSASADTFARTILRYDVTLQRCDELVSGLRTCDTATAPATTRTFVANGDAVGLTWNEIVSLTTSLGETNVAIGGALRLQQKSTGTAVCLASLQLSLQGVSERPASSDGRTCVDLEGETLPVFLFGSWRLEDDLAQTTYALSVRGTLVSTGN
jgi:hypothetical protein